MVLIIKFLNLIFFFIYEVFTVFIKYLRLRHTSQNIILITIMHVPTELVTWSLWVTDLSIWLLWYLLASEKYLSPYLSFKLSVRDKTWNWWIFPNRNLEHKYFEKLPKFCYLAKLWVLRSFTCWWKMIPGLVGYSIYQHSEHFSVIIYLSKICTIIPLYLCFSWHFPVFIYFLKKSIKKTERY